MVRLSKTYMALRDKEDAGEDGAWGDVRDGVFDQLVQAGTTQHIKSALLLFQQTRRTAQWKVGEGEGAVEASTGANATEWRDLSAQIGTELGELSHAVDLIMERVKKAAEQHGATDPSPGGQEEAATGAAEAPEASTQRPPGMMRMGQEESKMKTTDTHQLWREMKGLAGEERNFTKVRMAPDTQKKLQELRLEEASSESEVELP